MNAAPPAVRWATYSGDCRAVLTEGPKGPNTLGEFLTPVSADYDGTHTRVGFSYVLPPEYAEIASTARRLVPSWHESYDAVAAIVAERYEVAS